jgi:hypothetical protein
MKPDNDLINIIREDKVSRLEFVDLLPDYLRVDYINNNIGKIVDTKMEPLIEDLDTFKKSADAKFVSLRRTADMDVVNRKIDSKADKFQTDGVHETFDLKLGLLDKNQILLAKDFETF